MMTNLRATPLSFAAALMMGSLSLSAHAGMVKDGHGNVGYDTAAECDAAIRNGTAKFYKSFTTKPPLKRAGEASVKVMRLGDVEIPSNWASRMGFNNVSYASGACDVGVGNKNGRDGVAKELIGRYVPYSPEMAVNVYYDKAGNPVRVMMKQCDNNFGGNFPRPLTVAAPCCDAPKPVPAPAPAPVARPVAPAPAPAPAPVVRPAPAPAPVVRAPVVTPPPAPVPVAPAAAVKAATGGLSTLQMLGIGAAVVAVPLILNRDNDSGTTGATGTTGTTGTTR